jgi:hypothetical protein
MGAALPFFGRQRLSPHYYFPELQVSATFFTEVTSIVLAALAFAVAPADAPAELPVDPALVFPAALESGLFEAEADAFAPAVPVTSTSLFTFALRSDSDPLN